MCFLPPEEVTLSGTASAAGAGGVEACLGSGVDGLVAASCTAGVAAWVVGALGGGVARGYTTSDCPMASLGRLPRSEFHCLSSSTVTPNFCEIAQRLSPLATP